MPTRHHPVFLYSAVLEPWTRLALTAPGVVGLRLHQLPLMWWTNPAKAHEELQRMYTEKNDAVAETALAMTLLPVHFWLESMTALMTPNPWAAMNAAVVNGSRRMASPANLRVSANQRRLGQKKR